MQMKDYERAEYAFRQAVVSDSNNSTARFKLGVACLARRNRDCALSEYNRLKMSDDELAKRLFQQDLSRPRGRRVHFEQVKL